MNFFLTCNQDKRQNAHEDYAPVRIQVFPISRQPPSSWEISLAEPQVTQLVSLYHQLIPPSRFESPSLGYHMEAAEDGNDSHLQISKLQESMHALSLKLKVALSIYTHGTTLEAVDRGCES